MPTERIMYHMTVQEMREGLRETRTVILPVGVVEQHGYHLPLSTDIFNAIELAARTSARTGCFVAPPIHYSFSGGMLPGTINISPQTFSLVVMDICRSLVTQGFRHIVILLGHGGTENTQAAKDAAVIFQRLSPAIDDISISVIPFFELSPSYMQAVEQDGDYHAARCETSLMLYWQPQLVRMEKAAYDDPALVQRMRTDPDAYLQHHKLLDSPYVLPRQVQDPAIAVGVMGDITGASAEFGKQLADEVVAALTDFITALPE